MSRVVGLLYSRRVPQVAALALMSMGVAGCSADMSTRLSQDQFSNPFASQPEATGSVQPAPRRELPQYARPQPQYQSSALPPPISAPQSYPAAQPYSSASAGVSGGGRGVGSYAPPTHPPLEATGSVAPRSIAATHAQGGTTIIVGTSDTLEILSRRYNVPAAAIMQANGYKGPRTLSPGQQLIIPHSAATL
jgi:LysM repeat protein